MAGNNFQQTAATATGTVSTQRLKRSKAKKEEPNLKRTLFVLNLPAWLNHSEDILHIFRQVSDQCLPSVIELVNKERHTFRFDTLIDLVELIHRNGHK